MKSTYHEKTAQIMLLSHESMLKANYSQISRDHAKVLGKIFFQMFENTLSIVSITDRAQTSGPKTDGGFASKAGEVCN